MTIEIQSQTNSFEKETETTSHLQAGPTFSIYA